MRPLWQQGVYARLRGQQGVYARLRGQQGVYARLRMQRAIRPYGLALAVAVTAIAMSGDVDWRVRPAAGESDVTGGIGTGAFEMPRLPLSDEQRGHIFEGIMKVPDAPVADVAVPQPAQALPSSVELQDLPPNVTHDVPAVRGYKFVKLDDRVLLVSPGDRAVVAELPRYRLIVD